MASGKPEILTGVGALLVDPITNCFLAVTELCPKRSTNKIPGSISFPMETKLVGELEKDAFRRLAREEVQLVNLDLLNLPNGSLGRYELADGVVLKARYFEVPFGTKIIIGTEVEEVANARWMPLEEVSNLPSGPFPLRPGVREVTQRYMVHRVNSLNHYFRLVRHGELVDKIPDRVFDLIEGGLTTEIALNQYYLE